jgi:acylphosphatase
VEAVLAGPRDVVEAMIEACRRGPFAARVDVLDPRDASEDELDLRRPGELFSVLANG